MKFLAVKRLSGLQPIDEAGETAMRKMGLGEVLTVEVKRPRNVRFHAKFFAMLQLILANQDHYKSLEDLLDVCKLRTGHCRTIQTKQGEVRIPESISFATMDDTEFADFLRPHLPLGRDRSGFPGLERQHLDEESSGPAAGVRQAGRLGDKKG